MRLWHYQLIKYLPRQQLLGLHRSCAGLRGRFWGKRHACVNYVFRYPYVILFHYHQLVIAEMKRRGYKPNVVWENFLYRGKKMKQLDKRLNKKWIKNQYYDYPEHDKNYLELCIKNLTAKLKTAKPGKYDNIELAVFYRYIHTKKK